MEINDLKSIWNETNEQQKTTHEHSINDMKKMIGSKSKITIERVRKDLNRKGLYSSILGLSILVYVFDVYFFEKPETHLWHTLSNSQFSLMAGLMGLIVTIASAYMLYVARKINSDGKQMDSLKLSLSSIIKSIQKMMRVSVYSDAIGVPIFVCFIVYIQLFKNQSLMPDLRILVLPILTVIIFWLVRKSTMSFQEGKYGHYINSLEDCLEELEETNEK